MIRPVSSNRRLVLAMGLSSLVVPVAAQPALRTARPEGDPPPARRGVNRMALVIGNSAYSVRPLRYAVNDARTVAASLADLGYELITRENASLDSMLSAMKSFWLKSREADVRVIYFAGHGVVHEGKNYLLPVNAAIDGAVDVPRMAAKLDDVIDKLTETDKGVNVIILDACRTSLSMAASSRFLPTGMEPVLAPRGTVVAFSTAPGSVAYDGKNGNSPYSRHLSAQLRIPGQPIEQMFKRVRQAVAEETANRQIPWENSSLTGDFCFQTGPKGLCPSA
jgi:uncharacterized caspase-like protein